LHIGHTGETPSILGHRRHIHDTPDVNAAVANEDADPWLFLRYIFFCGISLFPNQCSPCSRERGFCLTGSGAGLHHGIGDILRLQEGSAYINTLS
jgi:hypothetical protein